MKFKKILACMLSMILSLSSLAYIPPLKVSAETTATATPITSIKYDFAISGTNGESSLDFLYTTVASWENGTAKLPISGDGDYSVTVTPNSVKGLRNMGWFTTVTGSTITATLTKITVNGSYELNYSKTLQVGSTTDNGLDNIWNTTTADTRIAEGSNCYIARNGDDASKTSTAAFIFYVTSEDNSSVTPTSAPTGEASPTPTEGASPTPTEGAAPTPSVVVYPENGLVETSLLSAKGDTLISNSSAHVKTSYDGLIQTNTGATLPTGKYFKITFTADKSTPADTKLFTIQPFDSSWGGWNDNIITFGDAQYDSATDSYVAFLSIDTVKNSLVTGKSLKGINISFFQAEPAVTLTGYAQLSEPPVSASNPKTLITLTETDLATAGITGWSSASKATVYIKITEGNSDSLLNGVIKIGRDENGDPTGKASSKYLVGSTNAAGKTGNAIQDNIVGAAGTGIYKFPDINLNKVDSSNAALPSGSENYITLTIAAMSENTECELLGIVFNNGKVYPAGFTVPTCESITYDPVVNETLQKDNLKLTLDYCVTMDSTKYTAESWATFQTALAVAQEVYNKANVTEDECKAARALLEDAKTDMLFVTSTDPGNPQSFRDISDDELIYEMGAGINLGNTLDGHTGFTPSETVWQPTATTKAYIKALHDAGYNTVRIPVTWGTMIDDSNGYAIKEQWISRVQDIVDYCVSLDMYAIINIHHDGAEQSGWLRVAADDIDSVYEKYEYVWRNIAEYFKDYDEHLIFESMNEITCMEGDSKNSTAAVEQDTPIIMNLNQIFVNVVRSTGSNNTKRWLAFVSHYANGGTQTGFTKPNDTYNTANRLMFAAHIYKASTNVTWTYDEVYQVVSSLKSMANKWDVPMYLGEYGTRIYVQSGTESGYNDVARAYFSEIVNRACQVAGVVPVVWDQGYDPSKTPAEYTGCYSYWNRLTCLPIFKTITDAMMRGTLLPASGLNMNYNFTDIVQGVTVTPITDLTISSTAVSLKLGESTALTASVEPADTNDVVLWSTDDDTVATVYRGFIQAKGIGTTTLHAYSQSGSIQKDIAVTVTSINTGTPATEITTGLNTYTLAEGGSLKIYASLLPAGSTDEITYKSSNTKVVTVNELGKLVAIKKGTAYVTLTASSGITKTVKVVVTNKYDAKSITIALNVLYNDSTHKYYGLELGDPITITGDGQYTVTFDLSKNLSAAGKTAGITEINKLTAIFLKDYAVATGADKTSPVLSAEVRYDSVTVNGQELTITNNNFKSVLSSAGVFDSGGPLNGYDGNSVAEASTSSNVVSFTGITAPTTMTVTFTIQNLEFVSETPDKLNEATKLDITSAKDVALEKAGDVTEVLVNLTPLDTDSYVSFVSSDQSVVVVDTTAVPADGVGIAFARIKAVGNGTAVITAMTENGLTVSFNITVGETTATPTPTPIPTTPTTPVATPTPVPTATPTPSPAPSETDTGNMVVDGYNMALQYEISQDTTKGNVTASIQLPADEILAVASSKGEGEKLKLNIPVASQQVIDLMNGGDVTDVKLKVTLPDSLLANGQIELSKINLDKTLLEAAKAAGSDITVSVTDENGNERYSWTFKGDNLKAAGDNISDVNLALSVEAVSQNSDLSNLLTGAAADGSGIIINLNQHGVLPAQSSIKIYVGDQTGIKPGDRIYLYYYNSDSGKLDTLPYSSSYMIDSEGYITINLVHCSEYVILPKEADSSVINSLKDQIKVTVAKKTLYIGGTTDSKAEIKLELPSTLELVNSLKDKTSGDAIGAVTVSYKSSNSKIAKVDSKGTITAVGTGTVKITATITLYSGKTKVVSFTVKVKKPSIIITGSTSSLTLGGQYTFSAAAYGYDSKDITWTTSKKSVVVINKKTGVATAQSVGTDYVIAKIGDLEVKVKVTVKK